MSQHFILELIDGQRVETSLAAPFEPNDNEIHVFLPKEQKTTYSLSDISCILFDHGFEKVLALDIEKLSDDDSSLEEVATLSGNRFNIRALNGYDYKTGFFALSLDPQSFSRVIFFTYDGIILRSQYSPLCDILKKQGVIPKFEIEKALEKQQLLKTRRVGDILAERREIKSSDVGEVLLKSEKGEMLPVNARVGDILIAEGLVSRQQVDLALANQMTEKKKKIGEILVESGLVTEEQMLTALAVKFRMRFISLYDMNPDETALKAIPEHLIHQFHIFPAGFNNNRLVVATSDPTDISIFNLLRFSTKRTFELAVATSEDISAAIQKYFPQKDIINIIAEDQEESFVFEDEWDDTQNDQSINEEDSQIVRMANKILIDAYEKRTSDIHFEPGVGRENLLVRYRTDGICRIVHRIPPMYKRPLIARIKILSRLDITEHRKPQSGKIRMSIKNKKVEYRVEITPTVGGNEDAVLRVLTSEKPLDIERMGFSAWNLEGFKKILAKPYGIILCVGPTGAGKTTTLHSALGRLNTPGRKIWTVEDPVEITQTGLRQVQVHAKIGFTFQTALRSLLRADPDVIMIGEMRDSETAKIAIEASLTGHLVLSTLHTNSATETVIRLIEMGIDPLNFSDALLGILAQRLTLKLCDYCKTSYYPTVEEFDELVATYGEEWYQEHGMQPYSDDVMLMRKTGCERCHGSGYRGRLSIHELLVATESVKRAIRRRRPVHEIENTLLKNGMKTLKMDGIQKVFDGLTDLNQVVRVCN